MSGQADRPSDFVTTEQELEREFDARLVEMLSIGLPRRVFSAAPSRGRARMSPAEAFAKAHQQFPAAS